MVGFSTPTNVLLLVGATVCIGKNGDDRPACGHARKGVLRGFIDPWSSQRPPHGTRPQPTSPTPPLFFRSHFGQEPHRMKIPLHSATLLLGPKWKGSCCSTEAARQTKAKERLFPGRKKLLQRNHPKMLQRNGLQRPAQRAAPTNVPRL